MKTKSAVGAIAAMVLMTMLSFASTGTASAAPAPATQPLASAGSMVKLPSVKLTCGSGRCIVKLTNAETRAMGSGKFKPVATPFPPLTVALAILVITHKAIAAYYGARGWCSQFVLSIYPWESQGYMRASC